MNPLPTYCYRSVATGRYADLMESCVVSAREAGVGKEFHVLTDRPILGAESYDAFEVELTDQLYKLVYLKAAISKLNFDYYVWLDADTIFRSNPRNVLACLSRSPIRVPLEVNLSELILQAEGKVAATVRLEAPPSPAEDIGPGLKSHFRGPTNVDEPRQLLFGLSVRQYAELFVAAGVCNPVYWSRSAFWIVRRTAIERVCELALHFRAFARERGVTVNATAGLSYAMQMLCGDPAKHELRVRPDLWMHASYETEQESAGVAGGQAAIIHFGTAKQEVPASEEPQDEENKHELVGTA